LFEYNIFTYFTFYIRCLEDYNDKLKSRKVNNMYKLILISLGLICPLLLNAQQDYQVSHFMFDQISINPGSAGNKDNVCVNGILRQQWPGIDNAPENFILNADFPFKLFNQSHGFGLSITRDKIGFYNDISLKPAYAFRANAGSGKLGIGISLNIQNRTLKPQWQIPENTSYHTRYTDDPLIPESEDPIFAIDVGFGLFYKTEELYVGFSSTHVNEGTFRYNEATKEVSEKLTRHYYITSGYDLVMPNPSFELKPAILIQSDGSIHKIDLNIILLYNKKFWGGVTYRPGSAVVGMLGLEVINGLKIAYAYDFDTSAIMKHVSIPYEIAVSYCFKIGIEKTPQKYKSIRFL
jgi:type IX secretion system PorP/SprF family membrane protein